MVRAFRDLTGRAKPGDQVYIHYSGHGGRARTAYPDLKSNGLDEALVPCDIGNSEARYLRDIELAHLLEELVVKGLAVTLVLDSCHSGGATRALDVAPRGVDFIDEADRPTDSMVASPEELARTWQALTGGATAKDIQAGAGWLPEPKGYVLLAACQPTESAYETSFGEDGRHGALTYWLLDGLKRLDERTTYRRVFDRLVAKVHAQFAAQTPVLMGDSDRVVLGADRVASAAAINVLSAEVANGWLMIDAGQVHGLRLVGRFAVYPPDAADLTAEAGRLALAELADLGSTTSRLRITERSGDRAIEEGYKAVLLEPGIIALRRKIQLLPPQEGATTPERAKALEAVADAIKRAGSGWVVLAAEAEPADLHVTVDPQGRYEIGDAAGVALPNLRPPIGIDEPGAADRMVARLVHLARYNAIRQLDNFDRSMLTGRLVAEIFPVPQGWMPGDKPEPWPWPKPGVLTIAPGGQFLIRIANRSPRVLNLAVLNLTPSWAVAQIYPGPDDTDYLPIDPGEERWLPTVYTATLRDDYAEGAEVLKVFASLGATSFRWLELPSLDQPPIARKGELPADPLEQMLAHFAAEELPAATKDIRPAAFPSKEWVTAMVELRVWRPIPGAH